MSWLGPADKDGSAVHGAALGSGGWTYFTPVAQGVPFFDNWADFPSIVPMDEARLLAHWLQRGDGGGYDYSVQVAVSEDLGATWSAPRRLHDDGTPTEHGFVTLLPDGEGGVTGVWLDGRNLSQGMTLRGRRLSASGELGAEALLDGLTCDCCQTDAARLPDGEVLVVYRDRSPEEIRDISMVRGRDGDWSDPEPVSGDGWHMEACPVNGPAIAVDGDHVAVAWFTGEGNVPRVSLAVSEDRGHVWSDPTEVDGRNAIGRVDVEFLQNGDAVVLWMARGSDGSGDVRVVRVTSEGVQGVPVSLRTVDGGRGNGFPQLARLEPGVDRFLAAWTVLENGEPRVEIVELEWKGAVAP